MKTLLTSKSQVNALMAFSSVKTLEDASVYLDTLYDTLYYSRTNSTLQANTYVFSNPFVRFTIDRNAFAPNPSVCF